LEHISPNARKCRKPFIFKKSFVAAKVTTDYIIFANRILRGVETLKI